MNSGGGKAQRSGLTRIGRIADVENSSPIVNSIRGTASVMCCKTPIRLSVRPIFKRSVQGRDAICCAAAVSGAINAGRPVATSDAITTMKISNRRVIIGKYEYRARSDRRQGDLRHVSTLGQHESNIAPRQNVPLKRSRLRKPL